ncbi:chemotaxis protein CheA [Rossellomorea marisflavi]|uniref:chemotaxis protein CheA n=1 Tax=Rossellomorea marisflavi TaxID=189381 RepID=UPI00064F3A5D|nr:chemotaxis protein CheA [Rossellomorea marisflavi]KML06461.1 chemotaxis protein CheA [Rossellomorea marisflavi]KML32848.1 chemotaxis protein CheA [Rossellomorea marisflavi]
MEMSQYLEIFIEESKENLQACNEQLLALEKHPNDLSIVNEIFRAAHTLKGMAATMGYDDLANLTHKMENVLDGIRNGVLAVTPGILDVVFQAVDDLEAMVFSIADGGDGKRDVSDVVRLLQQIESGDAPGTAAEQEVAATATALPSRLTYEAYEQTVIEEAIEQGFKCFEISVSLREDCLLKAARVYMVFELLEKDGEVIKSDPPVDQLEEERFDRDFTVSILTMESAESMAGKVESVSEIDRVSISPIETGTFRSSEDTFTESSPEKIQHEIVEESTLRLKEENAENVKKAAPSSKTIRVNIDRLDILMNLFEELVIDRGRLEEISKQFDNPELNETVERMTRISGDLQSIILNMRMVPVETVFNRFPRMVRQLAKDLDKQIELEIEGAETELDRTVIDEIGDPLVHLIRNAIDHGIETPEVRTKHGKEPFGTVKLKAYHSGNHVFIELEDDGAGINKEKVLQKAIDKGIVSSDQALTLSDRQIYELILSSGFSTAEKLSDISGRGVGLDVVRSTIESLGGSITIDSTVGEGSRFSIQLPLTLSIIAVMLVDVKSEKYAIPLSSIIETAIIKKEDVLHAHNQKVIDFRGKVVPLLFLEEVFEVPSEGDEADQYSIVLVRKGEKTAALVVDSFIGQQEVVLKSLGHYLNDIFAISGATILGDGQVALIIDCNALIH